MEPAEKHPNAADDPDHPAGIDSKVPTIRLSRGAVMPLAVWINCRDLYRMDRRDVQRYYGEDPLCYRRWRLEPDSLEHLLEYTSDRLSIRRPATQLCRTFAESTGDFFYYDARNLILTLALRECAIVHVLAMLAEWLCGGLLRALRWLRFRSGRCFAAELDDSQPCDECHCHEC